MQQGVLIEVPPISPHKQKPRPATLNGVFI
jgi:hypothetical protein